MNTGQKIALFVMGICIAQILLAVARHDMSPLVGMIGWFVAALAQYNIYRRG